MSAASRPAPANNDVNALAAQAISNHAAPMELRACTGGLPIIFKQMTTMAREGRVPSARRKTRKTSVRVKWITMKARRPLATAPNPIACSRLSAPASGGYIMSDISAKVEMGH